MITDKSLVCCGEHIGGDRLGGCCDPNDCGPCCENCPTCPTLRLITYRQLQALAQMRAAGWQFHYRRPSHPTNWTPKLDEDTSQRADGAQWRTSYTPDRGDTVYVEAVKLGGVVYIAPLGSDLSEPRAWVRLA